MKIDEKCSCGAEFHARGLSAAASAAVWRVSHPCPNGNGVKWDTKITYRTGHELVE